MYLSASPYAARMTSGDRTTALPRPAPAPLTSADLRRVARDRLAAEVWDFIEGGSGDELTLTANEEAFRRVRLRPRTMVDVSRVDTATRVLGTALGTPVGI